MAKKKKLLPSPPPPKAYPIDGLATIPDAAEFLAVSRSTIYNMLRSNQLDKTKMRAVTRIDWRQLHAYVEQWGRRK